MHTQQFVMISKTFSDGVSLQKDGPKLTKKFSTESVLTNDKTFRTAVWFVPKLVPKHFVTTLIVGEELTYFESIALERRTVMQKYSETTNIFMPKEIINNYCSSLLFEPDATKRLFTAGIELLPAQKSVVTVKEMYFSSEDIATECGEKGAINGDLNDHLQIVNGEM